MPWRAPCRLRAAGAHTRGASTLAPPRPRTYALTIRHVPSRSYDEFVSKAEAPVDPAALCGDLIEEYAAKGGATCGVYCGALDGDEARRGFLTRAQSSMRWYIENYSAIDLDDERWRFFAVFEKPAEGGGGPRLVAAATVFRFTRFASGGLQTLLRICQVLVLPPYRRMVKVAVLARPWRASTGSSACI